MYRASTEAPAFPDVRTARTGAALEETLPRGMIDTDLLTLNLVGETSFGVVTDETVQHDSEAQLSSIWAECCEVCGIARIDIVAAPLDTSCFDPLSEFRQQIAELELDPQILCAQVMVAKAG